MIKTGENARLSTLDWLLETVVPLFVSPVPSRQTLRDWLDSASIPRFKANPAAKRGGGTAFYSVSAVEEFFRSRTKGARSRVSPRTSAGQIHPLSPPSSVEKDPA